MCVCGEGVDAESGSWITVAGLTTVKVKIWMKSRSRQATETAYGLNLRDIAAANSRCEKPTYLPIIPKPATPASSEDQDQTSQMAASDLGLHCLHETDRYSRTSVA